MRATCWSGRYPESLSMDSATPEIPAIPGPDISPPPLTAAELPPRVWKFWGTALWGLVVFAAMFVGQIGVVDLLLLAAPRMVGGPGAFDFEQLRQIASNGLAISLSVMAGLPAVLLALWLAIRWTRIPFADYLALRWTSWGNVVLGAVGLVVLVEGWDLLSHAIGHEATPGFHDRGDEVGARRGRVVANGACVLCCGSDHRRTVRARVPLPRLVGIVPPRAGRDRSLVAGLDRDAFAV